MAGEVEAKRALKHKGKVRMVVVTRAAFSNQQVTISGYKDDLRKDSYDQIMNVLEEGSDVTLYERGVRDTENQYLVLVEDQSEVGLISSTAMLTENN
ncbi:MAG: DUF4252 domain-containing protein [Chryseolinea sp.]